MLHYRKGANIEKELTKEELPFDDCLPQNQTDFLWMHVKGGTKVENVISYAKNALDKGEHRTIVWSSAGGGGVVKTISCAEILKRSYPLYQVTRMCYAIVEEHWLPQMDGLEEIIAKRQIPTLHILMSLDPIDDTANGLQRPGTKTDYWVEPNRPQSASQTNASAQRTRGDKPAGKRPPRSVNGNRRFPQRPNNAPQMQDNQASAMSTSQTTQQSRSGTIAKARVQPKPTEAPQSA